MTALAYTTDIDDTTAEEPWSAPVEATPIKFPESTISVLDATAFSAPIESAPLLGRGVEIVFFTPSSSTSDSTGVNEWLIEQLLTHRHPWASSVQRIHDAANLTWEEVAQLFGVSRRAVHNWAAGRPMNSSNRRRLEILTDVIFARRMDPDGIRAWLMGVRDGGTSLFRRLVRDVSRHDEAEGRLTPADRMQAEDRLLHTVAEYAPIDDNDLNWDLPEA